ncbi:MAG TPA: hypothetical protein VGO62_06380 [Myxococcota bacterium]|jgi:hypothetical protein
MRALALVLVVAASGGCRFGDAQFQSTVTGRQFDPAGTVFTYVDATDDNLVVEKNPRVAVAMTWIIFDPNSDLNDLDGSSLADYSHELKLRDAMSLVFDQQGALTAGAGFISTVVGGEEQGSGQMTSFLHLEPERVNGQSTYAAVIPFASKRTTNVTVTSIDFSIAQPVLAADVSITFARSDTDPGNAREGAFTGSFQAPVVGERVAEENLSLLNVHDVLGLPLGPRTTPPAASAP